MVNRPYNRGDYHIAYRDKKRSKCTDYTYIFSLNAGFFFCLTKSRLDEIYILGLFLCLPGSLSDLREHHHNYDVA